MSVALAQEPKVAVEPLPLYRLSVEQYHRMAEQGILTQEDRVELIDGYLVKKMTINPAHGSTVQWLTLWLIRVVPTGWIPRVQLPITFATCEPEPDLAIVVGSDTSFRTNHPSPSETVLVVEVADSSLSVDRDVKANLYAEAGIPEYWLVNLVDKCVQVFTQPTPQGYGQERVLQAGDDLVLSLQGEEISRRRVAELLPE